MRDSDELDFGSLPVGNWFIFCFIATCALVIDILFLDLRENKFILRVFSLRVDFMFIFCTMGEYYVFSL